MKCLFFVTVICVYPSRFLISKPEYHLERSKDFQKASKFRDAFQIDYAPTKIITVDGSEILHGM